MFVCLALNVLFEIRISFRAEAYGEFEIRFEFNEWYEGDQINSIDCCRLVDKFYCVRQFNKQLVCKQIVV